MQTIHLKSPKNWINDPNGFIYYKGKYHMFYQHFPYEPRWGTMHWGHAISDDLVTWEHKDIALFPSKFNDMNGCFSGSAIEHDGKMYIYYTGVRYLEPNPEDIHTCLNDHFVSSQMMITSDDGIHFDNMHDKAVVIPPFEDPQLGCADTRDPKVWRGVDAWYIVMGSRTPDRVGKLLFYKSYDLKNWEYVNSASRKDLGWMWECPDYFETDGTQLLVLSPMDISDTAYTHLSVIMKVNFDESTCTMSIPDEYQLIDYGKDLYAPQSTVDADGRRVIVAWARMPEPVDGVWNGMYCIPRVVEVKNGHIFFRVHPNIRKRFSKEILSVKEANDAGYLISLDINDGDVIDVGGYLIKRNGGTICTDRSKVFNDHNELGTKFSAPEVNGDIHIDIYVDKNLIETYINDGEYVISNVVYGLGDYFDAKTENRVKMYTVL